jgi:hypothetical protein
LSKTLTPDTAVYAAILKMDEQPDGTLLVHGKATDDTLDSDEQVCDPEWLKSAMPQWFKYGNIREQHGSVAAGVATEYKSEGSEHFITAHVVDAGSVAKVKAGVLKGFSIGIRKPRVAKDNKALGGRIVDGEIVEISLVDRPANPACTLTMAKTINSELVQVEEFAETAITAASLVESAKSFTADLNKFDQTAFNNARVALATLIQVEAGEMADGSDETHSLACLFSAVHALFEWHEGEAAEGETEPIMETETEGIEMSTEPESVKEDSIEMCDKCNKSMDECKCAEGGYRETEVKADSPEMCDKCGKEMKDCKCDKADKPEESADEPTDKPEKEKALTVSDVKQIVTDIVKTLLTPDEVGEDTVTKSIEAERIEALESELEQVKALAAPSSVKRMGAVSSTNTVDENLVKAQSFRAKANATNDRTLARGYLEMARELETKSN